MDQMNGFYTDLNGHSNGFQSSHQDDHQTKLESFRKMDAERDAFVQVSFFKPRLNPRQAMQETHTIRNYCAAIKTYVNDLQRNAMTSRTKRSPDVCGRKGQIWRNAIARLSSAIQ